MTKSEYYSVLNIQNLCKGLYFTPYVGVMMRSVLKSLQMEFNAKYKGTPISVKNDNEVFDVLINSYSITFIVCYFETSGSIVVTRKYFDADTKIRK